MYANPKDKRILVPKKLGIGWTFNFGNPVAVLLVTILIVIPIVVFVVGSIYK